MNSKAVDIDGNNICIGFHGPYSTSTLSRFLADMHSATGRRSRRGKVRML